MVWRGVYCTELQSGTVVAGAEAAVEAELERARQEQLYTTSY